MNKIQVIIPTLNAATTIERHLNLLKNQDILVIDSSSTDDTVKIAQKLSVDIVSINQDDFNHATTRNIALNYQADFYLFLTQDAQPVDENLVENLLKSFEDTDIVVSYARQIPYSSADLIEKFARDTNYPEKSKIKSRKDLATLGIKTFFNSNSCAMYRASYFKKVGGFEEGLIMNEDMEFAACVILNGKKIAYVADAKVYHSHDYNMSDIFKRYFDIGVFFKTNSWITDEVNQYMKTESTGVKQAMQELRYLFKIDKSLIPKSFCFSMTKYLAFKLGFYHQKLPKYLRVFLSLHKNWHK